MALVPGLLTKDITLSYKKDSSSSYEVLDGLQEVPSLGGTPDKVEVTTLSDASRRYIKGIKDYGDLTFKFLYQNDTATSNFRILRGLEESGKIVDWKVEFPDGTGFAFSGECTVAPSDGAVNAAITFNLTISLNSDITVTNPAG